MSDDHRLSVLEQRVTNIDVVNTRMDTKLDGIAETLQSLARIEERQMATTERLRQGAETFSEHEQRLRSLEIAHPADLAKRVSAIEVEMPGLKETRKWSVMLLVGSAVTIFASVVHLVISK